MDPLKLNHSVLKFVGVCDVEETTPSSIKLRNQLFYTLMVAMHTFNATATSLYFVLYMSVDYNGGIYGLLAATVLICNLHTLITLRLHSNEMQTVFSTLRAISRENENSDAFRTGSYAYQVGSNVTKIFVKIYGPVYFAVIIFISITELTLCYLNNELFVEHPTCVHVPYRYVLPWDQTTLTGYLRTITYLACFSGAYFVLNAMFLTAFVVICLQFDSLRIHFKNILSELKNINEKDFGYEVKIKNVLCKAIRFHILMRDLFTNLQNTFTGCIFVQLLGGVIFMSTSMFQMDLALRNPSLFILTSINVLFTSSSNLYLYCFGGMVVTDNALKYADIIFELDWYKMPNELQKYFILMIAETQRPIYLDGYGIIRVSLEGFSKILRTVCSYYLMFTTLAV